MLSKQQLRACRGVAALPQLPSRIPISRTRKDVPRTICAAAEAIDAPSMPSIQSEPQGDSNKAFPYPLPMEPGQQTLAQIPLVMFYPAVLAFAAGAGFVGSVMGRGLPVDPESKDVTSYATAAIVGAGALYAGVQAKKKRDAAAVVDLYNTIVELPEPYDLTEDQVAAVGAKFGINMQKTEKEGLLKIYSQYLESVIPSGEIQLRGDEADHVRKFKEALGLTDEDAAEAHIDVARRLYRQGFETKDRVQQFEQRKAFQRLVYVSQLVFGDQKTAFLLPWRRHFQLTEAQLFVARRDNAKTIFKSMFEAEGVDLKADRHFLRELRDKQMAVKMMDESAVEVIKELSRKHVETHLLKAMAAIKATGMNKDMGVLVSEMEYVLDYSQKLAKMADDEDLIPGLGQVSIQGGPLAAEGKSRELKDLYKTYLEEKMERLGEFTATLDQEAKELQFILSLGSKDAQVMRDEVAAKLYKRLLKDEVSSRRIDEAESPASILQSLCEKVRFSPEAALELHKQLYRTKMKTLVDKGLLTQQDQDDLKRIRRILCIPTDVANKVAAETSGKILQETISEIFALGIKPVSEAELLRVDKVVKDLGIDPDVAMEMLSLAARERFRSYLQAAQKEREDRKEFAGHIKRLVQFNSLVVTPMLERVKGMDAAKKELAELLAKAVEEAKKEGASEEQAVAEAESKVKKEDTVKQVQKAIQANRGEFGEDEKAGQKEIVMKQDVEEKTRAEIYKNFLMFTMSGDVVELPVGGMVRKKNNPNARQADMARLQQLADLLGMDQMEMMNAQRDLAEQAYKGQVTDVMRSGPLTQEKSSYLEDMRNQLGLSKEASDKVIKAARQEVYGTSAVLEEGGRWTLDRILEVNKKGETIEGKVEEVTRRNIFRKELERSITDGSGDLDPDYILHKLPALLALEEKKVKPIIKELVQSRKRMLLVQALSQYRQKRPAETVQSLQNLLSCTRAQPEKEPMQWTERAELRDIFQAFCTQESSSSKRDELKVLLGLTDGEAHEAESASDTEEGKSKGMAVDESFF